MSKAKKSQSLYTGIDLTPVVQRFILMNMIHGGYDVVAKQVTKTTKKTWSRIQVYNEIQQLKATKNPNSEVVTQCLHFLEQLHIEIPEYIKQTEYYGTKTTEHKPIAD